MFPVLGYGSPWSVGEFTLYGINKYRPLVDYDKQRAHTAILSKQIHVTDDFYDVTHYFKPIHVTGNVIGVGRSSYLSVEKHTSVVTNKLLWTSHTRGILLDNVTNKPTSFDDVIRRAYPALDPEKVPKPPALVAKPELGVHKIHRAMELSDCDSYLNIHSTSYERFCHDVGSKLCMKDAFSVLKGDLGLYKIQTAEITYRKLTKPDDELVMYVWEDARNPCTLHFHCHKSGSDEVSCQVSYTFEPTPLALISRQVVCKL